MEFRRRRCPTNSPPSCAPLAHLGAGALPQEARHLLANDLARRVAGSILRQQGQAVGQDVESGQWQAGRATAAALSGGGGGGGWAVWHPRRALKLACTRLMMALVRPLGASMAWAGGGRGGRWVRGA